MSVLIETNNFANDEILEDRIYLHVPYSCGNKCRFYGGKWDKGNKRWYFVNDDIDVDREELMQWKEEGKKVYYRISYDRREKAKDLGLHFDKDKKKWFHYEEEEHFYENSEKLIDEIKQLQKW